MSLEVSALLFGRDQVTGPDSRHRRLCLSVLGHGLMGVLMHPPHYLHSLVFSFTPGSVDLEKAC